MSIFKHNASLSLFNQIRIFPGEGFLKNNGIESDKYCIGNYPFKLNEYYRLVIQADVEWIEGSVCRISSDCMTRIGKFEVGEECHIMEHSSNGVALERYGMENPCECKSRIYISSPLRVDIFGNASGATQGFVKCEKCSNVNVRAHWSHKTTNMAQTFLVQVLF